MMDKIGEISLPSDFHTNGFTFWLGGKVVEHSTQFWQQFYDFKNTHGIDVESVGNAHVQCRWYTKNGANYVPFTVTLYYSKEKDARLVVIEHRSIGQRPITFANIPNKLQLFMDPQPGDTPSNKDPTYRVPPVSPTSPVTVKDVKISVESIMGMILTPSLDAISNGLLTLADSVEVDIKLLDAFCNNDKLLPTLFTLITLYKVEENIVVASVAIIRMLLDHDSKLCEKVANCREWLAILTELVSGTRHQQRLVSTIYARILSTTKNPETNRYLSSEVSSILLALANSGSTHILIGAPNSDPVVSSTMNRMLQAYGLYVPAPLPL